MGITGLLPFIKNSCRSANLRDFSGATVAIDAYNWLHKGAFSCAEKLVKGEKTDGYVFYCAKLLNMLLEIGVKPIMVFDGCNLRSKEVTEKKRRENREKTRQRGKELLCEGKLKEARECFQRCVDVTPEMAREVIEMCRKKLIECIVAPYEADAQLAYLDKIGVAQIIITEDSDLVLFGCSKILFKMDSFGGGFLYEKENLPKSFGANASKFSFEKFRYMCILSGCDYLPSLPGIGLAKACKFFMLTCNPDLNVVLKKLPSYLKMPKLEVNEEYIDSFIKANNTFLYQLVFCPKKKCLVPLNPYPEGVNASDMEYAGKYLPEDIAFELAIGNINVKTLKQFCNSETDESSSNIQKSSAWESISEPANVKPPIKVEASAFKFNSQKIKGVKRKVESSTVVEATKIGDDDDEIFSMYRNPNSSMNSEENEEDPLAEVCEKKPKLSSSFSLVKSESESPSTPQSYSTLSLKRVVRSRFFAPKEEKTEAANVLRENSPENLQNIEENLAAEANLLVEKESSKIVEENEQKPEISPIIKSNKENIAHRFAKKVAIPKPSPPISSADITSSLTKVERSWLDIIDNECTSSTSTISSSGLATKLLGVDLKNDDADKTVSESNKVKIKKTKLISTKILDFKWDKLSSSNKNSNHFKSETIPSAKSPIKSEDDIEILLDSDKCDNNIKLDLSDSVNNSVVSENCDIEMDTLCDEVLDKSISTSENSRISSSQESSSSKSVISSAKPFASQSSITKPGKCRQIGLSKNRKNSDKKLSIKDTLMNFNFVRKPKDEVSVIT